MALIAPLLLTFAFGIMQVGYAFMVQHALQNAAYKGCRAGTLPNRTTAAVMSAVTGTLNPIGLTNNTTITIQVNKVAGNVSTAVFGDEVSVILTIPLSDVTMFPGFFGSWNGTLRGAASFRCQ